MSTKYSNPPPHYLRDKSTVILISGLLTYLILYIATPLIEEFDSITKDKAIMFRTIFLTTLLLITCAEIFAICMYARLVCRRNSLGHLIFPAFLTIFLSIYGAYLLTGNTTCVSFIMTIWLIVILGMSAEAKQIRQYRETDKRREEEKKNAESIAESDTGNNASTADR